MRGRAAARERIGRLLTGRVRRVSGTSAEEPGTWHRHQSPTLAPIAHHPAILAAREPGRSASRVSVTAHCVGSSTILHTPSARLSMSAYPVAHIRAMRCGARRATVSRALHQAISSVRRKSNAAAKNGSGHPECHTSIRNSVSRSKKWRRDGSVLTRTTSPIAGRASDSSRATIRCP